MFIHSKRTVAVPTQPKQVVVEKPVEDIKKAPAQVERSEEPNPTKEKPVVVAKKEVKRKKSILEELLEDTETE